MSKWIFTRQIEFSPHQRAHVRRSVHGTFWVPTTLVCGFLLYTLVGFLWDITVLAGWLISGAVVFGHPAYEAVHDELDYRVLGAGVLIVMLGIYLVLWVRWYRKALRMTKEGRMAGSGEECRVVASDADSQDAVASEG